MGAAEQRGAAEQWSAARSSSAVRSMTRAMQAGLVDRKLTFRDVFTAVATLFSFVALLIRVRWRRQGLSQGLVAA